MTKQEMLQLKMTATRVRMGIIEATHGGKSGHPGGSLSAADVLTYLYFKEMQIDPQNPQDPDRDRFVLSRAMQRRVCTRCWQSAGSYPWLTCLPCAAPAATCRATPT